MIPDSSTPRLSADVTQRLRALIHAGQVLPGQRFPAERELATSLSVSRMTLREALKQLQNEGYVEVRRGPHGGTYVTGLQAPAEAWLRRMDEDPSVIDQLFDFRVGVEMAAAHFAALRRTDDDILEMKEAISAMGSAVNRGEFRHYDSRFHEAVASAARSPRLLESVRQLRGEVFTPIDLLGIPTSPQDDAESHLGVLQAIEDSDPAAAAARIGEHLEHTRNHLRTILSGRRTLRSGHGRQ